VGISTYERVFAESLAQPIVGMFPPTSLLAGPAPPKVFDFYQAQMSDLLEFTIEVNYVVQRTALVHGVCPLCSSDSKLKT
jgi:histone-arginine methyltransferase CARM1